MQIRQRIFNCTAREITHFILDKIQKFLTLYAFLTQVVAKLSDLKNSPVFLAHPVDWRVVVVVRGNVLQHAKREGELSERGNESFGTVSYSHSIELWPYL